jgi:Ser/Thr protein kinase RdoA (MazF antagonist)
MLFDTFSSLTLDQQLLLLLLLKKYTIYENNEKWQAVLEGYKQYRELSEYELSLMKIFC